MCHLGAGCQYFESRKARKDSGPSPITIGERFAAPTDLSCRGVECPTFRRESASLGLRHSESA